MSAFVYVRCTGNDIFRVQRACPYDGWSSPETEELASAAEAMKAAGEAPSIERLRERGVSEAALRLAIVMDFGDDAASFDDIIPAWLIVDGAWKQANRYEHQYEAASLQALLAALRADLPDGVNVVRKCYPGVPRLELTRSLPGSRRYVEINQISDPEAPWRFGLLFGEYGSAADTDGRRGGDLAFVAAFVRAWLVELLPAGELPATA
jgi:hypothetical protein